jgi:hypothetical protein
MAARAIRLPERFRQSTVIILSPESIPNDPANSYLQYGWDLVSIKWQPVTTSLNASIELLSSAVRNQLSAAQHTMLNSMLPLGSASVYSGAFNVNSSSRASRILCQLTFLGSHLLSNCTYTFSWQLFVEIRSVNPNVHGRDVTTLYCFLVSYSLILIRPRLAHMRRSDDEMEGKYAYLATSEIRKPSHLVNADVIAGKARKGE